MRLPKVSFLKLTPKDLYRIGNSGSPRMTHVRTCPPRKENESFEVRIYAGPRGETWVDRESGGLSLFDAPDENPDKRWWKLPAQATIPAGLNLTEDEKLLGEDNRAHFTVRPVSDMPLEKFIGLLELMGACAVPTFR